MVAAADLDSRICCPRCGYDLRGAVAAWAERCPLQGTCAECGLGFLWTMILRPEKFEPQWCVEFRHGRALSVLPACAMTYLRSFAPGRFWSAVQMSHAIRPRRICLYIATLLLPLLVLYIAIQGGAAVYVRYRWLNMSSDAIASNQNAITNLQAQLAATVARGEGQQAPAQQLRGRIVNLQAQIVTLQATPVTIDRGLPFLLFEAMVLPLQRSSGALYAGATGMGSYVAPRRLVPWTLEERRDETRFLQSHYRGREWSGVFMSAASPLATLLAGFLVLPAGFLLLPVSRGKAQVRWAHISRVCAYSAFAPLTVLYLGGTVFAVSMWFHQFDAVAGALVATWIPLISWALLLIFWTFAIRSYLRMPHALLIVILLSTISFLITAAATYWIGEFAG